VQPASGLNPAILLFTTIRWSHLFQRQHHFARMLAVKGFRVFWVDVRLRAPELAGVANLAAEIEPNLYSISLPCAAGELYQLEWHPAVLDTMEAAFGSLSLSRAIQLVHFPKWTPIVRRLRDRFGWPIIYDCLDDQQAFDQVYPSNAAGLEQALIADSAALIASGRTLQQRMKSQRADPILIGNAADFDLFGGAMPSGLLSHLPRPIIGFFGAFADWLDFDWIEQSARRFPQWSFVYIGRDGFSSREARERWTHVVSAGNIHVIGQQPPATLATYCAEFDVCVMPFQDLQITRSMNAVKIYEYLAAGKPVVARDLPETRPLAELGLIDTYNSIDESLAVLARIVATGARQEQIDARRRFAAGNTWKHRVDQLISVLRSVIAPAPGN
jgi:glycosyltransferase involved in cell wall biosynthesis